MGYSQVTTLWAGCKANLYLRIVGRREDGYHDLRSLFVPLAHPRDQLQVSESDKTGLELDCSDPEVPRTSNTLHKAYEVFTQATGWGPGLKVWLQKNIPLGSGLGGGSADAAALLTYLNARCPHPSRLSSQELVKIAARVGADVPFFLLNKPAWVTGIGDQVRPVSLAISQAWLLIVCPRVFVSTAQAYAAWDELAADNNLELSLTKMEKGDSNTACTSGRVWWNSFEALVFEAHPVLRDIKRQILQAGGSGAVLSGSGAAVVGLFRIHQDCQQAKRILENAQTQVFCSSVLSAGV